MAGSSRADMETYWGAEITGLAKSQWAEDVNVTLDDKLHMSEQTSTQTVQGPLNFSNTSVMTVAGPFNNTNTNVNTFGGPFNNTNTNTNTWSGPMDLNSTVDVAGTATFQTTVNFNNTIITPNSNNLHSLVTAEVSQLANIGTTTISATQWGYLGAMDQSVTQSDNVVFNQVETNTIRGESNTNHRIQVYAGPDEVRIYPGNDSGDAYLKIQSSSAGSDYPFVRPSSDQFGYIGDASLEWKNVFAVNVYRNGTPLDHYDDLEIIENVGIMKDKQGNPVKDHHGNPFLDPETLPDFLRPPLEQRKEGKAHVELGRWTDLAIGAVKQLYGKHKEVVEIITAQAEEILSLKAEIDQLKGAS